MDSTWVYILQGWSNLKVVSWYLKYINIKITFVGRTLQLIWEALEIRVWVYMANKVDGNIDETFREIDEMYNRMVPKPVLRILSRRSTTKPFIQMPRYNDLKKKTKIQPAENSCIMLFARLKPITAVLAILVYTWTLVRPKKKICVVPVSRPTLPTHITKWPTLNFFSSSLPWISLSSNLKC